jgi:hypothetical protein
MTLHGPTPEDVRKLHLENNQIVNQQHLITAAAITTFGVVLAWHLPDLEAGPVIPTSPFVLHGAFLLLVLLVLLFLWSTALTSIVRTYAEYLLVHGQSGWEADWRLYRERFSPLGYAGIQSIVFMILGLLTAVFPVYIYGIRALWDRFPSQLLQLLVVLLLYEGVVFARGIRNWPDPGKRARRRWAALRTEPVARQAAGTADPATGSAAPPAAERPPSP